MVVKMQRHFLKVKMEPKKQGRPYGIHTLHIPPHLKRMGHHVYLPTWMMERLLRKQYEPGSNMNRYIESLILKDTGWKAPNR